MGIHGDRSLADDSATFLVVYCHCVCEVVFVGVRGVSELSDIAIDNLQIATDACPGGTTPSLHLYNVLYSIIFIECSVYSVFFMLGYLPDV